MEHRRIDLVKENGLCIGCGACAANCPIGCIKMTLDCHRHTVPVIDEALCIKCGKCLNICSVHQLADYKKEQSISDWLVGDYINIECVQCKDKKMLRQSTSGGVITQLVSLLMENRQYDAAFLVDSSVSEEPMDTVKYERGMDFTKASKSKYVMISHETSIRYMLQNPVKKIIFVGTGCVFQAIENTIQAHPHELNRDNYLFLGLFCDKTMHHGVIKYFKDYPCGKGRQMAELLFRTKQVSGWPGNMQIVYSDGTVEDLPNTARGEIKTYFMPERCAYCLDKLNRNSDIAVGDNYIKSNADSDGISSVIVRTIKGKEVFNQYKEFFLIHEDSKEELEVSQVIEEKKLNYEFACLKGLYGEEQKKEASRQAKKQYSVLLKKMEVGNTDNVYINVRNDIEKRARRATLRRYLAFPIRVISRMYHKLSL